MEIKVEDYLSQDEIKEIVKDELRSKIRNNKGKDDLQRVIYNVSHSIVVGLVNEYFDEDLEQLLKDKVIDHINNLTPYTVFKNPDAWDRTPAAPYHVMEKTVVDNQHLIKERFEELVKDLSLSDDFQVDFDYEVKQLIMARLFGDKWADEL